METFLQLLGSGLALGAMYALIALGFVVIYRASQVFNFAQGDLLGLGAFLMVALNSAGLPWGLSLLVAMLLTGLVAAGIERAFLRPLIGRPVFVTIIITIFVGFLLRTFLVLVWGPQPYGMATPWDTSGSIDILGATVLLNAVAATVAGAIALTLFFLLIKYSRFGVAMRATASDQEAALALGIPVGRIFGATWFIAGAYAALAGIFLGMFPRSVDVNLGYIALRAFPAAVIGGLDSAAGAVIAGLALGVLEVMTQGYINPNLGHFGQNFHAVFPYVAMILFLIIRPYGLFGREEVKRV